MKNIERELIRSVKLLPQMQKSLEFNNEVKNKRVEKKMFVRVGVPILAVLICLATTFTVSAQVRESIINFVKSAAVEIIPSFKNEFNDKDSTNLISVKHNEIEKIADVYYYELDNKIVNEQKLLKDNIKSREIFNYNQGTINKLEYAKTFNKTVTVDSQKVFLDFDVYDLKEVCMIEDYSYCKDVNTNELLEEISFNVCKIYDTNILVERIVKNDFIPRFDVFLYDMNTNVMKNLFKEILPEDYIIDYPVYSKSGRYIILKEFDGGYSNGRYLFYDVSKNELFNLETLTNISNIVGCKLIDDNMIYIETSKENKIEKGIKYDGYVYMIETGKSQKIYDAGENVIFSTGLITIKRNNDSYIIEKYNGEYYQCNDIDLTGVSFLPNASGTKIAIFNSDETKRNSLHINQLGIIDINAKKCSVFQREGVDKNQEYSIGWDINGELIIVTNNMLCQYVFK